MLHLSAKRHRFIVWWEDALWKTFWETIWRTCYSIWFSGWVLPCLFERPVENPSSWKESLTWIVPRIRFVRGWNLEGFRSWKRWTHQKSTRKDSMQRKQKKTQREWNFYFSNRRWTNQNSWRRAGTENIHLDTGTSNSRRKSRRFSWRIRRDSSTTSWLISGCRWSDKWFFISGCRWSDKWFLVHVRKLHIPPSRWTKSQTLLVERRIIPYSTEIHWRLQNYSYEFGCQAREAHRWLLEYRWVSRLVRSLDRVHTITLLEEKAPDGYMWSGERLTRKQLTSRPDHLWPELWKSMGKHAKLKEKQKWSDEEIHLENARKM